MFFLVIISKQRPRKIRINGNDGKYYDFLLKGHEDLRQDERVMQLFTLINTLLENDSNTNKQYLSIETYSVVPLSPNCGVIGWIAGCDTLNTLIRTYREERNVSWLEDHAFMQQPEAKNYDPLTLIQKVQQFSYALNKYSGDDLKNTIWLTSANSEVWLERRTNFTKSLAVMSIVGYILGLGDRHPDNLMLERVSGKIIHIDFGDCFEVTRTREKYPERVPFRLTRMLINAMEVCGIEGKFIFLFSFFFFFNFYFNFFYFLFFIYFYFFFFIFFKFLFFEFLNLKKK